MKILLNPRTAAAYGQDVLAEAMERTCGLTVLHAGGYALPTDEISLVVSMNLDERADSECVRRLPRSVKILAHVHCSLSYYSPEQSANLTAGLERVSIGIAPARFLQHDLRQRYPHVDWQMVHNGVNRRRYAVSTPAERAAFRTCYSIPEKLRLAIFVGRLEDAKGFQILEKFCQQIANTNLAIVVQFPANTAKAQQIFAEKAKILQRNAPDRVFLCPDSDLKADRPIRHADLLLMPSLSEVCPLVVLEAFTAGIPVLGTAATPFYDELHALGIRSESFHFVGLPRHLDFKVERKNLEIDSASAENLAAELTERADLLATPSQDEREALSRMALQAGFEENRMLKAFAEIYDSATQ